MQGYDPGTARRPPPGPNFPRAAMSVTFAHSMPTASRDSARSWQFAVILCLAWLGLCAQLLVLYWQPSAWTLPDADDAMRLVQVREFLSGHGWFDLHEARLSPPMGYDSHWSRFIDAGLAGLYFLFRPFADRALAERLMVVVWPLLWLLPAMFGAAAIAWRLGGRNAAVVVLVLAAFCGPGMQQFRPGRIDHHNVHIALALLVVAATVWSDRSRFACRAAGTLTGFALAIGFEALPFLLMCGAFVALRYVIDRNAAPAVRNYGCALAASTLVAFLGTVPPPHWTHAVCDMIAVNSTLAVIAAGLGVAAATYWRSEDAWMRAGAVAAVGAWAAAVFTAIEPRCLGGVYAMVDPAIRPIWLDNVSETKSLFELIHRAGATGLGSAAFPAVALIAAAWIMRSRDRLRAFGPWVAASAFFVSVVYMIAANRGISYAVWLGTPFVAVAAIEAFAALGWANLALRFAATIMLTPTAVTIGAVSLASAAGSTALDMNSTTRQACVNRSNYADLAGLPEGLVAVNELEWGPYVLAWTQHSVLAAPYHRVPAGIVASHEIFSLPPAQARRIVDQAGVRYLFVCGQSGAASALVDGRPAGLLSELQSGAVPGWLKVVGTGPPTIYRVER